MTPLIAEELLLLAYSPDGTAPGKSTQLDCALGGALLAELVLGFRAEVAERRVEVIGHPPEHPELAAALIDIDAKPRRPQACVTRLSKGLRRRLLAGLVETGVLTDQRYRWLGLFTRHRFPPADLAIRDDALRRLRAAVIEGHRPEPRTAALASMVQAAGLDRRIFPDDDRKAVTRQLRELADGDWAAEAVRRGIQQVHTAAIAAATAASAAAASTGGGG